MMSLYNSEEDGENGIIVENKKITAVDVYFKFNIMTFFHGFLMFNIWLVPPFRNGRWYRYW